jgi:hypothetical protein
MMGAFADVDSQRANVMIAPNVVRTIITLKTPNLSPR